MCGYVRSPWKAQDYSSCIVLYPLQYFNNVLYHCAEVLGMAIKVTQITYLLKKICYNLCHAKFLDHTTEKFHRPEILKTYYFIDFNACMFMYKVIMCNAFKKPILN